MSRDPEPGWHGPDDGVRPDPAVLDSQLGDLIAYCRAVSGREEDAVSTAHAVLDSARSLLTDPERLRAWLFALARTDLLPASAPAAQETSDLVHRHGIRPEDLPVVLGISPAEAGELLAAADEEAGWDDRDGCWDDTASYLTEGQSDLAAAGPRGDMFEAQLPAVVAYCRSLTGQEDDAVSTAQAALGSARYLLTDPDRLRAWLFSLARQDMLGDAAPGAQDIVDLVHRHGIRAEDLPIVLGIPPNEADELLAAAEEEYARSAFGAEHRDAAVQHGEGPQNDRSWDDRAAAWDHGTAWTDDVGRPDGTDWDEAFGPKTHRLQDLSGVFRNPPESAGRHAAPGAGGVGLRRALARGPVRVAAAAGIVVAVLGVSAAYFAGQDSPPPSQAGHQTKHRPPVVAQFPARTAGPTPTPTATPTQGTSQRITVAVQPPPPAAPSTSPPTSSSPAPSPSPSSSSPPPSPTPTPTPSSSAS